MRSLAGIDLMRETSGMECLATLATGSAHVVLRRAVPADLSAVVALLAADQLGAERDGVRDATDLAACQAAFVTIDADPAQLLVVAEATDHVVGTLQRFYQRLGFVPSHEGMKLAL
jgi:hypothetical protein